MVDSKKTTASKADDYTKKAIQDEIAMEKYIDDLVALREDLWVKPENKAQFKKALKDQLNDEINNHFINLLTKSDQQLLNQLLDKGISNEELNMFFEQRIDNRVAHLATVFQKFKEMVMVGKKL